MKEISKNIRERRLALGLSQRELSNLAFGTDIKQNISAIETGRKQAHIDTIEKIIKALNCHLVIVPDEKLNAVQSILK